MAFIKNTKVILAGIVLVASLLRLFNLGTNPPALYWDESSLGFNAFAISESLHDEHGEFLPFSRFIAYGDYKPPLYIYAAAPFVKIFGLNEFTTRLPSALSGIALTVLGYFLVLEILRSSKLRKRAALLTSFIIAISPWMLQISRAAFEANLATALMCAGVLFLLKFFRTYEYKFLFLGGLFATLPVYTFNSHRVSIPLLVGLIFILNLKRHLPWKKLIILVAFMGVLVLPAIPHLVSPEGRLRFQEVAWVNDLAPIIQSNDRIATDSGSLAGKILHNRRIVYGLEFLNHFSDHLNPDYLFVSGDENPKLSIQKIGEFYWFDLALILLGLVFLIKFQKKAGLLLVGWIIIGIIPAALARETPHALRTAASLPAPQIIIGVGLAYGMSLISGKYRKLAAAVLSIIVVLFLANYLTLYYKWYPLRYASAWQYGYKQMVLEVTKDLPRYKGVVVTKELGRPYIYFLFYNQVTPEEYLKNSDVTHDSFGFYDVNRFGKIYFTESDKPGKGWLYVRVPGKSPQGSKVIKTITDLEGKKVFEISTR